jgi:putative membrane protein
MEMDGMKASRFRMFAMAVGLGCALALSAAGQMGGKTPAQTQPGGDQAQTGDQGKSDVKAGPALDQKFVKKAMEASLGDVEMGRLALQKSTDSQVRHFAIQETDDHGKILDDLKQVAQQLSMSVPDGPSKGDLKDIDKLKALSGDAFDQAFLKEAAKRHKDEDKSYKDEARTTTSPQLKDLITQEDQILGSHLQQAQQLAQAKGKK